MMTGELQFLAIMTFVFIALIFLFSSRHNMNLQERKERKEELEMWERHQEREHQRQQKQLQLYQQPTNHDLYKKPKQSSSQVVDTLDWMLAHSIITPQEYSQLMGKCLPYIQ